MRLVSSRVQRPLQYCNPVKIFRCLVCLSGILIFVFITKIAIIRPENLAISWTSDPGRAPDGMKTILLWNSMFGSEDYGVGFGTTVFDRYDCPNTCWITNEHSQLEAADAVMVHTFNMGPMLQNVSMPRRYRQSQIFVFFIMESASRSYDGFFDTSFSFKDVFNLTLTFLESPQTDIYMPMGGITLREEPTDKSIPKMKKIAGKRLVAWFVSNCYAASARLEYARELAKHIPVHIYGLCGDGNFTCPPGEIECYNKVKASYLFYLAFENSFCQDYVTEKLFRTLTTHMVPIVYGYTNYSKLVPAKSFIDVRDFPSPKHLAKYLYILQKFPKKYMEYFQWKRYYSVLQEDDMKPAAFCKLCSILHTKRYKYKSNYDPVEEYWNPDKVCLTGEAEQKAVHLIY